MEKNVVIEEWFCFVTGKNVTVKTARTGKRKCENYAECKKKYGECKNTYIYPSKSITQK